MEPGLGSWCGLPRVSLWEVRVLPPETDRLRLWLDKLTSQISEAAVEVL